MPAPDAATLVARIRQAFQAVVYPGDAQLTDSTYGEEPDALINDFRGRDDWTQLDDAFLDQAPAGWGSAISFFSGEALRFYLPAYLIADINGALTQSDPAYRLCSFVTPQLQDKKLARAFGGGTLGEHAVNELSLFNDEQVAVIVDYLWWKLEQDDYNPTIEQALENYWLPRAANTFGEVP